MAPQLQGWNNTFNAITFLSSPKVVVLDSLSAQQKAELILDPSSGALENATLAKEVMTGILSSSGKEQLSVFFETFVNVTKEVSSTSLWNAYMTWANTEKN